MSAMLKDVDYLPMAKPVCNYPRSGVSSLLYEITQGTAVAASWLLVGSNSGYPRSAFNNAVFPAPVTPATPTDTLNLPCCSFMFSALC